MKNSIGLPCFFLLAGLVAACAPTVDMRGNMPHEDLVAKIQPGLSRDDVLGLLGTPSTTATYGGESWHYISSRTETVAFLKPEVKERTVITIRFDADGKVKTVERRGLADGVDVVAVERETPTAGKENSLLEQLLGNVGRFSKPPAGK